MPYGQYFHVSCHLQPTAKLCLKHSRCCILAHGKGHSVREHVKKSCAKCIQSYICSHPSDTLLTKPQTGSCFTDVPPTACILVQNSLLSSPKPPIWWRPFLPAATVHFSCVSSCHCMQKFTPTWVYKYHSIRRGSSWVMIVVSFWSKYTEVKKFPPLKGFKSRKTSCSVPMQRVQVWSCF